MVRFSLLALAALLPAVMAVPTAAVVQDEFSNLLVLTRASDSDGFAPDPAIANKVQQEFRAGQRAWGAKSADPMDYSALSSSSNLNTSPLVKRAESKVKVCTTTACGNCVEYWYTFSSNFCLGVTNTQCVIVEKLVDAHLAFWNRIRCNGNLSYFYGCGREVHLRAPGTGSMGFQVGR